MIQDKNLRGAARKRVFTFNFAFSSGDKKLAGKRDVYKVELRGRKEIDYPAGGKTGICVHRHS